MASEASSASGSMFGAAGSIMQGQAQANALDTSAEIARNNASLALQTGESNATRQQIVAGKKIGAAATGYGASGVTATSGSVMDVMAMSHANSELDRQNILHGADVKAINYSNQASIDELSAKSAVQASYFNAVSSVMMGGSKAFGQGSGANTTNYGEDGGEASDEASVGGDSEAAASSDADMEMMF